MEENQENAPVEQSEKASGNSDQKNDVVAYDSFQKVLSEKKQMQAKYNEMQEQLKALEEQKLQAEGNKDQLIENYRNQLKDYQSKYENTRKSYAWKTVSSTLREIAKDLGADTPKKQQAVINLMDDSYLSRIEADDDFNVDRDAARQVLEEWKKENSDVIAWNTTPKKMANGIPSKKPTEKEKQDLSKLSKEELEQLYKEVYKR